MPRKRNYWDERHIPPRQLPSLPDPLVPQSCPLLFRREGSRPKRSPAGNLRTDRVGHRNKVSHKQKRRAAKLSFRIGITDARLLSGVFFVF